MSKRSTSVFLWLGLLIPAIAQAASVDLSTIDLLQSSMQTALDVIFNKLSSTCVTWLGGFILLQLIFTQGTVLLNGAEWDRAWAKFLGGMFWVGICVYIYSEGADFIKRIANFLLNLSSGLSGEPFSPTYPLNIGISSAADLLRALDKGQGIFSNLNPFPSIMMGIVSIVILASCALIAFRILMICIETKIVIALSPVSFALMGLNALRDQGFAPFKYLIAMAYRVLILGAVLAAMSVFSAELVKVINNLPPLSDASVWPAVWAAALGYLLLGGIAYNANSIAAQLANGTSSMTTADMGGPAAIAGAVGGALGAAIATSGASLAAGGGKGVSAVSELMKSLRASSDVGINNASETGLIRPGGGASETPNMSMANQGNDNSMQANDQSSQPSAEEDDGFKGVPNPQPVEEERKRNPARDAAREARRQASAKAKAAGKSASVTDAAISGINNTQSSGKNTLDYLGDAHRHARNGQAHAVGVTINTHHEL